MTTFDITLGSIITQFGICRWKCIFVLLYMSERSFRFFQQYQLHKHESSFIVHESLDNFTARISQSRKVYACLGTYLMTLFIKRTKMKLIIFYEILILELQIKDVC